VRYTTALSHLSHPDEWCEDCYVPDPDPDETAALRRLARQP